MPGIILTSRVALDHPAADRSAAIRGAGDLLVADGCVPASYVEGMLAREEIMSTFVGKGIAIPHGLEPDMATVRAAGVSVLRLQQPVPWNGAGDQVRIVCGIAATAEEHLNVLSALAEVLDDDTALATLLTTGDPHDVVRILDPREAS
jgi:mannitol/fructose-specific phosphotransferase system IIA component